MINAAITAPLRLPNFMETLLYPTVYCLLATACCLLPAARSPLATSHPFVLTSQELEKL